MFVNVRIMFVYVRTLFVYVRFVYLRNVVVYVVALLNKQAGGTFFVYLAK